MSTEAATCQARIAYASTYSPYICGKPAKGTLRNGVPACGIHLAAERRRVEHERLVTAALAAAREERADLDTIMRQLRQFAPALHALPAGGATRVSVDAAELLALVQLIEART